MSVEEFSQTHMIFGAMLGSCCCVPLAEGSGLDRLESAECGGDIEHKVERPTQQLRQGPDGPREAKGVKAAPGKFESKRFCSDKRIPGPCTPVNFCSSF